MLFRIKFYEELGEELTNRRKGFCAFDFFHGCSDERFFWPGNLCSLGLAALEEHESEPSSLQRCHWLSKSLLAPFHEGEALWCTGSFV